mmetsp:Transcript_8445/g.9643  ORF Transcript_8445/g.9643 Transcript_8445/m.9643 type:complete len:269 (-) Transcript_8445:115-921(-)
MEPLLAYEDGLGMPEERKLSSTTLRRFTWWTIFWWGLVVLWAILFYTEVVGFTFSAKISLYGVSIWLNGWMLALFKSQNDKRSRMDVLHDCLVIWMISYVFTNLAWEVPWTIFSRSVFTDLETIDDVVGKTEYMRESIFHLWFWVIGSFGTVDLRTVNHNSTFFTLELYAFVNIAEVCFFFHLNKKRSHMRYMIPVIGAGAPVAFTLMFSFTEVFNNFENMAGNTADTLLALLWTQYQYVVFPIVFAYWGLEMFQEDWKAYFIPRLSR